jgi:hypothetical protein
MTLVHWGLVCFLLGASSGALGQGVSDTPYSRLNTFTGFFEYSNDSSHILSGEAMNRKIGAVGFGYERRLLHRRLFDLAYAAEWRPAIVESDPTAAQTLIIDTPTVRVIPEEPLAVEQCVAGTQAVVSPPGYPNPYPEFITTLCGRRQVLGQSMAPLGVRLAGRTRHRLQPTFRADMGVLFGTQPAPLQFNGNFNVFFDFGVGLELYRTHRQSLRLEYLVQHYSNLGTVPSSLDPLFPYNGDPGVDSGFFKLTFSVGR